MSEDEVNHSQVGNLFMLGAGGIIVVILAAFFGRLPVFFWFAVLAFATAAWCAGATSFDSFFTARVLNGLFSTVAQGVSIFQHNPQESEIPKLTFDKGWPDAHQRHVFSPRACVSYTSPL